VSSFSRMSSLRKLKSSPSILLCCVLLSPIVWEIFGWGPQADREYLQALRLSRLLHGSEETNVRWYRQMDRLRIRPQAKCVSVHRLTYCSRKSQYGTFESGARGLAASERWRGSATVVCSWQSPQTPLPRRCTAGGLRNRDISHLLQLRENERFERPGSPDLLQGPR